MPFPNDFPQFPQQEILTGHTGLVCKICAVQHTVSTRTWLFPCLPGKGNMRRVVERHTKEALLTQNCPRADLTGMYRGYAISRPP